MQIKVDQMSHSTISFSSETQRKKHEIAKLIPSSLWFHKKIFNQKVSEYSLNLMNEKPQQLLKDTFFPIEAGYNIIANWLCVALGNPAAKADDLIQLAKYLGLNDYQTFSVACYTGNESMLKEILEDKSEAQKLEWIKRDEYSIYSWAIENYNTKDTEFNLLNNLLPEQYLLDDLEQKNYKSAFLLFRSALTQGHLAVPRYLLKKLPYLLDELEQTKHSNQSNDLHSLLCLASQMGSVELLANELKCTPSQVMFSDYAVIRAAAQAKQPVVCQYFKTEHVALSNNISRYYDFDKTLDEYCLMAKEGRLRALVLHESKGGLELPELEDGLELQLRSELEDGIKFFDVLRQAKNYEVLNQAANANQILVVHYLLSFKTCYDYATQNEQLKPFLVSFESDKSKISHLNQTIIDLWEYGEDLAKEQDDRECRGAGSSAVNVANQLQKYADRFVEARKKGNAEGMEDAKKSFTDEWNNAYKELGTHRAQWKSILAEVAIAATLIGLLFIAVKYYQTGSTFFSETRRQKQANEINSAFESLNPEQLKNVV